MDLTKKKIVNFTIKILKLTNIKDLYLGIIIKSIHFHLPGICLLLVICFPKIIAYCAFLYITTVSILFYLFGDCFISVIENELLKNYEHINNLNVVDPILNMFSLKINNRNRKYISYYVFFNYYLAILIILYFRFFFSK